MNKEEIRHFKSLLRQGSLRHMNIILDDKFQKELLNIIKDYEHLQQELTKYKERCEKCVNLLKLIQRNLPGYYNQLLIEISDLLETLEDKEDQNKKTIH